MDPLVRQFLTKVANADFLGNWNLRYPDINYGDPRSWGSRWAQDVQAYGHLRPGSAEYNAAMQAQGYSPEYMRGITHLGRGLLTQAQDSDFVRGLAAGQTPDFGQLVSSVENNPNVIFGTGPMSYVNQGRAAASTAWPSAVSGTAHGITRLNTDPRTGFGIPDAIGSIGTQLSGQAGNVWGTIKGNIGQQVREGAMGQLDRNSPLVRRFMSNAATTYAGNKIDDWTSGMGSFGRQLRGLGHFMLGMGSRLPGYETFSNKLVDWFGPDMSKNPYFKRSSMALPAPYSHYVSVRTPCGIEVLTPWTRR